MSYSNNKNCKYSLPSLVNYVPSDIHCLLFSRRLFLSVYYFFTVYQASCHFSLKIAISIWALFDIAIDKFCL